MAALKESLKVTGKVNFKLFDKDGYLKEDRTINNLVVTTGLEYIAARMADNLIPDQMSHMAIGEGPTAPALNNTTLGAETERVLLDTAGGIPSGTTITYSAAFPAGISGEITEAGVFNGSNPLASDMLCRTTFAVINKGTADTLAVSWEITIS